MDLTERIQHLKNQLKNMNNELDATKAAWIQSLDSFNETNKRIQKPATTESLKIIAGLYKQVLSKQLEVFRTQSRIIRTISPRAGDFLDEKVNELEKSDRKFQELNFSLNISQDEMKPLMNQFEKLYNEIESSIRLCMQIIQDTIKKFEK